MKTATLDELLRAEMPHADTGERFAAYRAFLAAQREIDPWTKALGPAPRPSEVQRMFTRDRQTPFNEMEAAAVRRMFQHWRKETTSAARAKAGRNGGKRSGATRRKKARQKKTA